MRVSLLKTLLTAGLSASCLLMSQTASAESATFTTPVSGDAGAVANAPDGAGVLVGTNETVGLLFETPFGQLVQDGPFNVVPFNNNVSIFTLSDVGGAVASVSFGRLGDNGVVDFFHSQDLSTTNSSTAVDFNFLAFVGCGNVGGCNFIQFTTNSAFNGAQGAVLDAITFSDVPLSFVTSSTPEPATWGLMIIGFGFLASRAKFARRKQRLALQSQGQNNQGRDYETAPAYSTTSTLEMA